MGRPAYPSGAHCGKGRIPVVPRAATNMPCVANAPLTLAAAAEECHMDRNTAIAAVATYFRAYEAQTSTQLLDVFRLRHEVYCVEHSFEDPAQHMNGSETDVYDEHSAHAMLVHEGTRQVCGCVRLILPVRERVLPMATLLDSSGREHFRTYPAATTAEVSRYAVSKAFRKRRGEEHYPDARYGESTYYQERRVLPYITIGLMTAVAKLSVRHGMTHLCAVMAPALLRLLSTIGMEFQPLGALVEYHGTRQPCIAAAADLLAGVRRTHPAYYDILKDEFCEQPAAVCTHRVPVALVQHA